MTWPTAYPDPNNTAAGFNYPASGLNNVAEYMASGLPFVTQSVTVAGSVNKIEFPFVTNFITVKNSGPGTLMFGFTENGVKGSNRYTVEADTYITFEVRCKDLFLSSSAGGPQTFEVLAGLTQILRRGMPVLTGSAAGFLTASTDLSYGYSGLG